MENFPELNDSQLALLRADVKTGHILDNEFNLAITMIIKRYLLFLMMLKQHCCLQKTFLKKNTNVECVIYTKEKNVLYHITPENVHLLI